tara:strand:+ start:1974 stop:2816 length:843 start_codon:yes stop_codon:yes gene_type:complete
MSRFDELTEDMGLTKTFSPIDSDAKTGSFETFFTVADVIVPTPANDTTTINRFTTINTVEEDEEVLVNGDEDSGFDFSRQDIKTEQEALFDPAEMLGLDGTYIANIKKANLDREINAGLVQEGADRNTSLTTEGGDPDYLRTNEIAFQDRLDAGEDVPTTDYIKAVGKYEGSRLNPDGNEEYKKANPEDAIYNYEMSEEEERVHNVYEQVTVENYTQTILGNTVKEQNYEQVKNQQLNSTKEKTSSGQVVGSRALETPEARIATSLSDENYNAIINSILK